MSLLWATAKDAVTTEDVRRAFEPVTHAMYSDQGHGKVLLDMRKEPTDLYSPSCVGTCDEVSERAQSLSHGVVHSVPGQMRMSRGVHGDEHVVLTHKGHIIDYTLRQYEPDAEVPHIQPMKDYMRERGFTHAERD